MVERIHVYSCPRFLARVPSIATIECQRQTEQVAGKSPLLTLIYGSLDILKYICLCHFKLVVPAKFYKEPQILSSIECDLVDKSNEISCIQ